MTEVESESGDDVMVEGYSEEEERESCEEQNQEEEEEEEEESAIWRLKVSLGKGIRPLASFPGSGLLCDVILQMT